MPALSGAITSSSGSCSTSLGTSGAAPTQQRFTSGSGATYTRPASVTLIVVTTCGGGGGGGGSGGTAGPTGTTGTTSTFNSVNAVGGTGGSGTTGTTGAAGGAGGTGGTGSATWRVAGSAGFRGANAVTVAEAAGGPGGVSLLGVVGSGGVGSTTTVTTQAGGGGGGAGECFQLRITSPSATYTYTVGGGGPGGIGTGTGAQTGGAGQAGVVQVDEYYAASVGIATVSTGVSAAGNTQGTATLLTSQWNVVSTVAAGTGVEMPVPSVGLIYLVTNVGANVLAVFPNSGVQINTLGNNVAIPVSVGATVQIGCTTTTQCYSQP